MLSELLARVTKMPVTEARGQAPLLPDQIDVIPPNATLEVQDEGLAARPIQPRSPDDSHHGMVIDTFFRSLAQWRKSQAIGVVLSCTGTDGTLGLAAIKAEGGIAFAQDQQSAKYPDMPRSASAQFGSADFVLPARSNRPGTGAYHPAILTFGARRRMKKNRPLPNCNFPVSSNG